MKSCRLVFNTLIAILLSQSTYSQVSIGTDIVFPKDSLIKELRFLNEAVVNGHPVNYLPERKISIKRIIDSLEKVPETNFSLGTYYFILGHALQEVGCTHTSIRDFRPVDCVKSPGYFPLHGVLLDNELYLNHQYDPDYTDYEGKKILSINGMKSKQLVSLLVKNSASDGRGLAFSTEKANHNLAYFIALILDFPEKYHIELEGESVMVKSIPCKVKRYYGEPDLPVIMKDRKNWVGHSDNLAYLRLKSFRSSDKRFFKKVFGWLDENEYESLVIDLRGNLGGDRAAGASLTRYLVDTTFSYSILQPNLSTRKYLSKRGRKQFAASKFKYNWLDCFKRRKTSAGLSFVYKYRPRKNKQFKGKVYVLMDGLTSSTSTMVTSWLKQYGNEVVFVGRKTGGGYNGNCGGSFPTMELPYTKVILRFAAYRLIFDDDSNKWDGLEPDHEVHYTIDDLVHKKDRDWEKVLELINRK